MPLLFDHETVLQIAEAYSKMSFKRQLYNAMLTICKVLVSDSEAALGPAIKLMDQVCVSWPEEHLSGLFNCCRY